MSKFWLMDQHGGDGLTALVETDGRLQIVDVIRFGPSITGLEAQQEVWDKAIGRVAPTMKPVVTASSVDEEGVAPHPELERDDPSGARSGRRASRRTGGQHQGTAGRSSGGPSRRGGRGDR